MKNLSWKAIFAGVGTIWGESLLFGIFSVVVIVYFAGRGRDIQSTAWIGFQLLMSAIFCLTGGFMTARIAQQAIYLHAVIAWGIVFVMSSFLSLLFPSQTPFAFNVFSSLVECGATLAGAYICANTITIRGGTA